MEGQQQGPVGSGPQNGQPTEEQTPEQEALEQKLKAELEEAVRERDQFRALAQRAQADFINYRKRVEQERDELQRAAGQGLLMRLFPILDDFERALATAPQGEDLPWLDGVRLIEKKYRAFLESAGVEQLDPTGKAFDPWEHEVVGYQEASSQTEGTVLATVNKGYKLHGKVIRPAQVVVAKTPAAPSN
jgi:molecular chaperone GrpE